jgi:Flp pilus assembly protein TadB
MDAMTRKILPLSVQTHTIAMQWHMRLTDRVRQAWHDRADESGVDEAVTKMIWLAVGIGVALAATAFFTGIFETARASVPDPVAP